VKEENFSGTNQVKSSIGRKIRSSILEQYPSLQDKMDEIIPKNQPVIVAKW
jgi:PUA domain protein